MEDIKLDSEVVKELDELKRLYRVDSYGEVIRILIKKINGETVEIIV